MLDQWDYEKNEISPDEVSAKDNSTIIFWKCKKCGYSWKTKPRVRLGTNGRCRCCDGNKAIVNGFNDVFTLVPELRRWYDTDKNQAENIDISAEGISSEVQAWWKCEECGRSWKTGISARIKKNPDGSLDVVPCSHYNTSKRKREEVPLISELVNLMKFWDFDKNEVDPSVIRSNSPESVHWKCSNCGHEWSTSPYQQLRGTGKCNCCELRRVVRKGYTDLFTLVPEAINSYDFKKNESEHIDPYSLSAHDKREVWWYCDKCGREWKSAVMNRVRKQNGICKLTQCRQCFDTDSKRIVPISSKPALMKFWDATLNEGKNCNQISARSEDPLCWKCKKCGYQWKASPKGRANKETCPCCDSGRVAKGINDILTLVPEIIEMYDFETNKSAGIDIYSVGVNSKFRVHWKCPNCGRKWSSKTNARIHKNSDGSFRVIPCSACSSGVRRKQKWSEQYPELATMFNFNLNNCNLDDIKFPEAKDTGYWWTCQNCGRNFQARIYSVASSLKYPTKGCSYCSKNKLDKNESFAAIHPELLDEYSPKNKTDPASVFPNNQEPVEWFCRNNPSHIWTATFALRHAGGGKCPVCNHTYVISDHNSFSSMYPDKVSMWSPKNKRTPNDTFFDASLWIKWICPDCGGEYGAYVKDVIDDSKKSCPYCTDKKVLPGFNSLLIQYPKAAKMWSPDNAKSSDEVLSTFTSSAHWICQDYGGTFTARICDIVSGEYECPFCTDKKVLPGFNSFKTKHPELMSEWNYLNNYAIADPDKISVRNAVPVWWNCKNNQKHQYRMSVSNRLMYQYRERESCTFCKGRRVKLHHFV